jgi:diketogulonate reductase-like aldo/keto reductase
MIEIIPQIGLGTATLKDEACISAIEFAVSVGYRMFDTALLYGNQVAVGEGIRKSGLSRDQVWITSKVGFFPCDSDKVWMYKADNVKGSERGSVDLCLQLLKMDYVDLMLLHNPCTSAVEYNAATLPHFFEYFNVSGGSSYAISPRTLASGEDMRELMLGVHHQRCRDNVDKEVALERRKQSWRALEEAHRVGKCRHIGVSNYPVELLLEMKSYATIMPAYNELEFHPRYASPLLREVAAEMGVCLIGYGTGNSMIINKSIEHPSHAVLEEVAVKYGRSEMQILVKWTLQHGVVAIPRSGSNEHITQNIDVFGFELAEEDMARLDALNEDYPYYWDRTSSVLVAGSNT